MKYAFIVNPVSGQGKHSRDLIPAIETLIAENPDKDIRLFYTCGERDATVLADTIAAEAGDEIVIFACGGDGTVQEAANGIYGHDNAVLGVVPVGSGNDFVRELSRSRGNAGSYKDLTKQLGGRPAECDLLKLSWTEGGEQRYRYITNGINIGFDGNTAILAHDLKNLPFVSGTGSYLLAVARNLAAKKGAELRIIADGELFHEGYVLLSTAANGGFCGGGVQSCANADLTDGLIELMAIKDVPRRTFVKLFPSYKAGKILENREAAEMISYTQARSVVIEPLEGSEMKFVGDGEIFSTGAVRIDAVQHAIRVQVIED